MGRTLLALGVVAALLATWLLVADTAAPDAAPTQREQVAASEPAMHLTPLARESETPHTLWDEPDVSTPASEPTATPADEVLPPLLVRVQHADGQPALVRGLLRVADETVGDATTRDGSPLRFEGREGVVQIWIGGATWVPQRRSLEPGYGRHSIRLPAAGELAGVVSLDGRAPPEPLPLGLTPGPEALEPELASAFRSTLHGVFGASVRLPILTDDEGRFRISGLPPGFEGRLRPPGDAYGLAPGSSDAVVATDLAVQLALVSRPGIVGRIVNAAGEAVPGAQLDVYSRETQTRVDPQGRSSTMTGSVTAPLTADAEGRFVIPIRDGDVDPLRIQAKHPVHGRLSWENGPYQAGVSHDLGDLALSPSRTLTWIARSSNGAPIAGAVARVPDERLWSAPSDEQGRGELPAVPESAAYVEVVADRHALQALAPPADDEPLEVLLQPCASLDVDVSLPVGVGAADIVFMLAADGPLRIEDTDELHFGVRETQQWLSRANSASEGDDFTRLTFSHGQAEPPWRQQCLHPGRTLTLQLRDRYGTELAARTLVVDAGRWHQELLSVHAEPVTLDLRVLYEGGRPAKGWHVRAVNAALPEDAAGARGRELRVEGVDLLHFDGVWARALELHVRFRRDGKGSIIVDVPAGGGELTLIVPADGDIERAPLQLR